MRSRLRWVLATATLVVAWSTAGAQQPPSAPAGPPPPNVGDVAPDFGFHGATRYGLLRDPMKLSDFRGQTVVLWLFIKARTRG